MRRESTAGFWKLGLTGFVKKLAAQKSSVGGLRKYLQKAHIFLKVGLV